MQAGKATKAQHTRIEPKAAKQPQRPRAALREFQPPGQQRPFRPAGTAGQSGKGRGEEKPAAVDQAICGARSDAARCQAIAASSSKS